MTSKKGWQESLDEKADKMGVEKVSLIRGEMTAIKEEMSILREEMRDLNESTGSGELTRRVRRLEYRADLSQKQQAQFGELNHQVWELLTDLELPFRESDDLFRRQIDELKSSPRGYILSVAQADRLNQKPAVSRAIIWSAFTASIAALVISVFVQ